MDPHWLAYLSGVGIILVDFNICDPEEGRLNVWNQSLTDGDSGKIVVFHSFFPHVLELAQSLITRGGTPQPLGSYALLHEIFLVKKIYLWLSTIF